MALAAFMVGDLESKHPVITPQPKKTTPNPDHYDPEREYNGGIPDLQHQQTNVEESGSTPVTQATEGTQGTTYHYYNPNHPVTV